MTNTNHDRERGSAGLFFVFLGFLIFSIGLTQIGGTIKHLSTQRSSIQGRMESTLKDAITATIDSPLYQAGDADPALIQQTITQVFAEKLQIASGNVVLHTFQVFTDDDAGMQAPEGIHGTIPGRSVYVDLLVTWTPPAILGIQQTGTYPVRSLVALPKYHAPGGQWN